MRLHHVILFHGNFDFVLAEFVVGERPAVRHAVCTFRLDERFAAYGDIGRRAFELPMFHHDDGAFVAANQAGNMLGIAHRRTQHQRMAFGIFGDQMERVRHFALVVEGVVAAGSHHFTRILRLVPANVQRRNNVEEQIGRDAA